MDGACPFFSCFPVIILRAPSSSLPRSLALFLLMPGVYAAIIPQDIKSFLKKSDGNQDFLIKFLTSSHGARQLRGDFGADVAGGVKRRAWLDFSFVPGAIILQANGSLVLDGLSLKNFARKSAVQAGAWPYHQDVGFIACPTIIAEPGSSVCSHPKRPGHHTLYSGKAPVERPL